MSYNHVSCDINLGYDTIHNFYQMHSAFFFCMCSLLHTLFLCMYIYIIIGYRELNPSFCGRYIFFQLIPLSLSLFVCIAPDFSVHVAHTRVQFCVCVFFSVAAYRAMN